ncbi:hypothetical protein ZIOFF_025340 [Zingiber officinale]|uniref:Uncharacterized protein n=1 Tax=Zingiber officinale TaxID=94328 RepID=A0A8J5H3J6_ZINOF|nr:hypothetical protein ZIOFF_025340 [Zingiber officinale]
MEEQPVADERLVVPAVVSVLSAVLLRLVECNDAASDGQRALSAFQGVRKPSISVRHYWCASSATPATAPPATSSRTNTSTTSLAAAKPLPSTPSTSTASSSPASSPPSNSWTTCMYLNAILLKKQSN